MSKCNFSIDFSVYIHYNKIVVKHMLKSYIIENKHFKTLNFLTLGQHKCPPGHTFSYAYTSFYLIHYVASGCGTFIKDGVAKKVSAGEIFIIKPDNVYTYIADENTPWNYIWFSFDGEIADIFKDAADVMAVDGSIIFEMLQAETFENTRTEFLTGKLYEFISSVFESASSKNNYVKKAADYIEANYMYKLRVKDIAENININSRYLSRIFKAEKGVSIQDYIINHKLAKAKFLLKKGFNVNETANLVGYDDVFTFSKIFKKHIGTSPSGHIKKPQA